MWSSLTDYLDFVVNIVILVQLCCLRHG